MSSEQSPPTRKILRFGVFEVDLEASELRKSGLKVHLQEQPFQVLAVLLERSGEIVTREELIQRLWPDGTFVEFDRSLNIAVNKIRDALGDSATSPRFVETVPRRGYRFVAPVEIVGAVSSAESELIPPAVSPIPWAWLAGIAIVAIIGYGVWSLVQPREAPAELPMARPLTSYPGQELHPTFSPDGNDVAFSWNGLEGDNFDIYRVLVAPGETRRQLTDDPANDLSPAWSPDGKWIAFLRDLGDGRAAVIRIPHIGGPEEQLGEVGCRSLDRRMLDWSPDGRWLAVIDEEAPGSGCAVFLLSVETRAKRQVVEAAAYIPGHHSPRFSPDGWALAYLRGVYVEYGLPGSLFVQRLSSELTPLGQPESLAEELGVADSPSWSRDGKEIIATAIRQGRRELWMVPTSGNGTPRHVAVGDGATLPVLSAKGDRLAYVKQETNYNIWRLKIPQPEDEPPAPERFISSTWYDTFPRYSPDGKSIVLQSTRSGVRAIWTCNSEAGDWRKLTSPGDGPAGSPSWSPDGKQIAFDTHINGQYEICTIPSSGGRATRTTDHPANDFGPSWSHDGKWIYFSSDRGGSGNVWKVPAGGGEAVQVTRQGGNRPAESPDGKWVYYLRGHYPRNVSLWRAPSNGGEEVQILDSVTGPCFTVMDSGIYFVAPPGADGSSSLQFYTFDEERARVIAPVPGSAFTPWGDCDLSPDRKWLLFRQAERRDADIWLVENFR